MTKENKPKNNILSEIEAKSIDLNREFSKIKFPAIISVISLVISLCFYGFVISSIISFGIFWLVIFLLSIRNLFKTINNDGLSEFYLKYKAGVILLAINIVFSAAVWMEYLFLSDFEKHRFWFHFLVLSVSLLICSLWLIIRKYLSKKSFVTYGLYTFLNFVVLLPFIFFLTFYLILRDLFKLF